MSIIRFKKKNKFSNQEIENLTSGIYNTLLEFDLPYQYVKSLISEIKQQIDHINMSNIAKIDKSAFIENFLKQYFDMIFNKSLDKKININSDKTITIGVFGLNGVGKTSFVAKIANLFQYTYKKRVLCVSFDFTRFSAQEQLQLLCKKNNIDFFPIVKNGIENGIKKIIEIINYQMVDVVIIDFAGTAQNNAKRIEQFRQILKLISFDERIMILDGTSGQNTMEIIESFNNILNITGFVVSKTDSEQKGGLFFAIRMVSNKPIYYVSNGEKINNIAEFNSDTMINNILKTEKISLIIDHLKGKEQCKKNNKYNRKTIDNSNCVVTYRRKRYIDFNDLLNSLKKITTSGKIGKLASMLPYKRAFFKKKITVNTYNVIRRWTAIISSMTKYERINVNCIDDKRMKRIADGSGTNVGDVNMLLNKISDINKYIV